MECAVCHKKENSKTACENGHYICNECHTQGVDAIFGICLAEKSKSPIAIIKKLMALPFLGVEMDTEKIECSHSAQNNQCIGKRCPFFKK